MYEPVMSVRNGSVPFEGIGSTAAALACPGAVISLQQVRRLAMNTSKPIFISFTPVDLWRLGVANSPRLDNPRVPPRPPGASIDIQTYERNGAVWVRAGSGGISTFDGINPKLNGTDWWKIPQNSPIPAGLQVSRNHMDRTTGLTHYRVEPQFDMPLQNFRYLLSVFAKTAVRAGSSINQETRV
jgi:hypothetical protein